MRQERRKLIDDLVADLRPVRRPGRVGRAVSVWLSLAVVYSVITVTATGPWREGAFHDLLELPLFAGETLLAVLAIGSIAFAAVHSAIPGQRAPARELWVLIPLGLWIAVYVIGLRYPVHPVSTLGARSQCLWQVVLYSLPSLGLALYIARRLYPLWPRSTGALCGAAAAAIPAALMQFGCMYVPSHILTHHIGPILVSAAIGALIGPVFLKTRARVPRPPKDSVH